MRLYREKLLNLKKKSDIKLQCFLILILIKKHLKRLEFVQRFLKTKFLDDFFSFNFEKGFFILARN